MGRIAEALKRAERERQAAVLSAVPPAQEGVGTEDLPAPSEPAGAPVAAARADAPTLSPASPSHSLHPCPSDAPVSVRADLHESLVSFHERASLITEQYRSLRTRLLSQDPNYDHRVLAITSAVPKEGKSVTTLNLACILAEIRHLRVLVVDGDFRRSSLAAMLNQPQRPGLADVLGGSVEFEQVIQPTPIPNLSFVPAGSTGQRSAAELLTAAAAKSVFQRMRDQYHYTIVDTPPANTVTDVGVIGQLCTGVILVVRLHRTDEGAAKRATRLLQVNNIPILGCLLVGRDAPAGRYAYEYARSYRDYYHHHHQDG